MTNDNEHPISTLFGTKDMWLYDAAYRYYERFAVAADDIGGDPEVFTSGKIRTFAAAERDHDPECFTLDHLWLYDASGRYYEILAVACIQMVEMERKDNPFTFISNSAVAFEEASKFARAYADHCLAVVDMAKRGESERDIGAFAFKYGFAARLRAEVWMREAMGRIADNQRLVDQFDRLRDSAAALHIKYDQMSASTANDRHSPLDGGTPVPAGAFEKTPA